MLKTACVITSINDPTDPEKHSVIQWAERMDRVYLVCDLKTPEFDARALPGNVIVIGNDLQTSLNKHLRNHYARKMLGYLAAYHAGYEQMFETDDDNFPIDGVTYEHSRSIKRSTVGEWFNVFGYAGYEHVCPRGFPPMYRQHYHVWDDILIGGSNTATVTQWWCENDPDVWAFYRMIYPEPYPRCKQSAWPVRLSTDCFGATNTQMTLINLNPSTMPLLYLPVTCHPRASDILRGWRMWANELSIEYAGPGVVQHRNPHDLIKDMVGEVKLLDSFNRDRCKTIGDFVEQGHCNSFEFTLYTLWLKELGQNDSVN